MKKIDQKTYVRNTKNSISENMLKSGITLTWFDLDAVLRSLETLVQVAVSNLDAVSRSLETLVQVAVSTFFC